MRKIGSVFSLCLLAAVAFCATRIEKSVLGTWYSHSSQLVLNGDGSFSSLALHEPGASANTGNWKVNGNDLLLTITKEGSFAVNPLPPIWLKLLTANKCLVGTSGEVRFYRTASSKGSSAEKLGVVTKPPITSEDDAQAVKIDQRLQKALRQSGADKLFGISYQGVGRFSVMVYLSPFPRGKDRAAAWLQTHGFLGQDSRLNFLNRTDGRGGP